MPLLVLEHSGKRQTIALESDRAASKTEQRLLSEQNRELQTRTEHTQARERQLDVNYRTAWYMAHRIRLAMQQDDDFCEKFSGVCEVDETYIGGKGKGPRGRSTATKIPVVGIKEKTSGKVRMKAVENVKAHTLASFVRMNVRPGSRIHHDEFKSYLWLNDSEFEHDSVNHSETYVTANGTTTNGVENVWSLFKRGIIGVSL